MEQDDFLNELETIKLAYSDLTKKLDPQVIEDEIGKLEPLTTLPDFWNNAQEAKKIMKKLGGFKEKKDRINQIKNEIDDIEIMLNLIKEADSGIEEKHSDFSELVSMLETTKRDLNNLEITTYLGGKYDDYDAIFSIHAGQGGTEACDWTQMLYRMYTKYFDRMGWKYEIVHEVKGNEAGISTISLEVYGSYAYGYLKNEHGTHRLVRVSPFNAQGLRQTSFAGVEVMPLIEDDLEVNLKPEDIEFSAVRSGGAGGQHVNKTATNVRLVHIPTGITVTNSSGRSQHQNKDAAMRMLRAKLFQLEMEKIDEEKSKLKGEHKIAGWGNQIRNYVLHPYKLIKDLRTQVQTEQPEKVLDGYLDDFIEAGIKI